MTTRYHHQNHTLKGSNSNSSPMAITAIATRSTRRIIPSNHNTATGLSDYQVDETPHKLSRRDQSRGSCVSVDSSCNHHVSKPTNQNKLATLLRSFLSFLSFPTIFPTCKQLTVPSSLSVSPSIGRKVTGTLFGHRRGHVSFAVQLDPRSEPVLLLELAMITSSLVKEMSSGLVRIALECEKPSVIVQANGRSRNKLFQEQDWTMYCNGRKCGYAASRTCRELDWHVLRTIQTVSVGAGVIPLVEEGHARKASNGAEGELLYMRAKFERVVGSRDSEAFYMLNPDGNGGPELSIFLLRL